ncbi:prostaglandin E2 receptor EP4 subtype isoform X2 [Toxorhynchites rutilus septentrionalis]|uniref:prostaglandin E2 receptor EP4 subtype isoform X2 n=1 Tax=Toxorhynchites rutilus septentrionalis TaxID=329112 RepID=UPI0024795B22|nr:prostaglandin E2 receptor EP4 subtype isoform X2 [Toxorhynchites rutilus septentrionalis]
MSDFPLNNSLVEFMVLSEDMSNGVNSTVESLAKTVQHTIGKPCRILIALSYIFGCVGNLIALIYLWNRKNVRNTKHSLMLKCLLTNDLIGLTGMFAQMYLQAYLPKQIINENMHHFCIFRVIWRVFGISSGCVAFVMALERYIALTKPFFYHKHVSDKMIRRSIFLLWAVGAFFTFLPLFGFGIYYDERKQVCIRYRDATEMMDVAYAYLFFSVGIILCSGIVICNLSVRKVLYRSHHKMRRQFSSIQPIPMLNRSTMRSPQKSASFHDSSIFRMIGEPTTEEIRFAKLMTFLSISFLACWLPQMVSILLAQLLRPEMKARFSWFFRLSDILILLHFMLDPYIYVLLRQSGRSDLRTMIRLAWPARKAPAKEKGRDTVTTTDTSD